jgi:hypothetical protein
MKLPPICLNSPILQSFLVKSNLTIINLSNLVDILIPIVEENKKLDLELIYRSGTIVALKYKNIIKGRTNLFKTDIGFKNTCHLIMCHTNLTKRKKKLIHVKVNANGTFQLLGIASVDVEKVIYKLFLILEKLNKNVDIFRSNFSSSGSTPTLSPELPLKNLSVEISNRLEIVIVPILNNYVVELPINTTKKIFKNLKVKIIQKFIDNNFLSFIIPSDPAITIKKSYLYKDFSHHPVKYITWNKKYGKTSCYIEYESYMSLLNPIQKANSSKKYITFRLYSSGKVFISGSDEILTQKGFENFLSVCGKF